MSFDIVSDTIYGSNGKNSKLLKQFVDKTNMGTTMLETDFYKEYIDHLHENY